MSSIPKVFWTDTKTTPKRSMFNKIIDLLERLKVKERIKKGDFVAIKVHFGERGNTTYLNPIYIRPIVEKIKEFGGKPFLTDTSTLYSGSRSEAVSHIETAIMNGFDYTIVGCPIIIADGLKGENGVKVPIDGEILKEVSIAKAIFEADVLVVLTHFKGHELTGFGGALKNMGMGCATREGKLQQHSNLIPNIKQELCVGCALCSENCPKKAIYFKENRAFIDEKICIGCGACIGLCPQKAINVELNESSERFQKKMVEFVKGVLEGKKEKAFFLNFLLNITPHCDCYPGSGSSIVRDIGVLASCDPVAIDTASCDLVNREEVSFIKGEGGDKWKILYPKVDWEIQLKQAEKLGLGRREYRLIKI